MLTTIPLWLKIVLVIVAVIILIIIIRVIIVKYKTWIAEQKIRKNENNYQTGNIGGVPVQVNLGAVASDIYSSFYNNDWFGWTEDEDRAIAAINSVPKTLMPQLKSIYYENYGHVLTEDCTEFLGSKYDLVKSQLD